MPTTVLVLRLAAAVVVAVLGLSSGDADALPGDLAPTFGSAGLVTLDVPPGPPPLPDLCPQCEGGAAEAVALQPDGRILVGSRLGFALAWLEPDGALDIGFGDAGLVPFFLEIASGPVGAAPDEPSRSVQGEGRLAALPRVRPGRRSTRRDAPPRPACPPTVRRRCRGG